MLLSIYCWPISFIFCSNTVIKLVYLAHRFNLYIIDTYADLFYLYTLYFFILYSTYVYEFCSEVDILFYFIMSSSRIQCRY